MFSSCLFLKSAALYGQSPHDIGSEIAFIGRSNSGKSSALNTLTQSRLFRTSKTPGRTQLLNFFQIAGEARLVDLPGYGYAKINHATQDAIQQRLSTYFQQRQSLCGLVWLMDIRHPFTKTDNLFFSFLCNNRPLPLHILLTKSDKLKKGPAQNVLFQMQTWLQKEIQSRYKAPISIQLFSSLKKQGVSPLTNHLSEWLNHSS
jgi:GTP-binding protein